MQNTPQKETLTLLCRMGQELVSVNDLDSLLHKLNEFCRTICHSDRASILLLDEEKNELYFKKAMGIYGENLQKIRIPLTDESIAGWVVKNKAPLIVKDVSKDPRHYKGIDLTTGYTTKSIMAVPIMWMNKIFGCMEALNKLGDEEFTQEDIENANILAQQAAVALNNSFYIKNLQNFFIYSVETIIAALENLEPKYKGHIPRVARYCTTLAREIGIKGKELETIWQAAYFHDLGKLKSKRDIFLQGKDLHPVIGAGMIEKIKLLEKAAPIVKYHHEKYDGSGFPEGLKGKDIPLGSRILSLVEDYEEFMIRHDKSMDAGEIKEKFYNDFRAKHDPELMEKFYRLIL